MILNACANTATETMPLNPANAKSQVAKNVTASDQPGLVDVANNMTSTSCFSRQDRKE